MEQLDSNDRFLVARSEVFKLEDVSDFGASQAKCFPCCVDFGNCLAVTAAMPSRQIGNGKKKKKKSESYDGGWPGPAAPNAANSDGIKRKPATQTGGGPFFP